MVQLRGILNTPSPPGIFKTRNNIVILKIKAFYYLQLASTFNEVNMNKLISSQTSSFCLRYFTKHP